MCPTFPLIPRPAPLFGEGELLEPVATLTERETAYLAEVGELEDPGLDDRASASPVGDDSMGEPPGTGEIPATDTSALEWGEDEVPGVEANQVAAGSPDHGVGAAYASPETELYLAPYPGELEEREDPMAMADDELAGWATPELTGSWLEEEDFFPGDLVKAIFRKPTVGFEFDVHYGPIPRLPNSRNGDTLSTGSASADGFKVKLDGPRLEVNTRPFETTASGRQEIEDTAVRIATFAEELNSKCRAAGPGVGFTHSTLSVPVGKLPTGSRVPNCSVWAAPQATITVKLSRISALVDKIRASEGGGPGVALSAGSSLRMGLRSEAIYRAQREVKKARRATPFSDELEGFLILLASYLWTSELPYRYPAIGASVNPLRDDYEEIGKAFLPVNVKNPLSQVFKVILSAADQQVFRDQFADGAARVNLFRLARPSGAALTDGTRKFLPTGKDRTGDPHVVHAFQRDEFGVTPTWDDLVTHTLDPTHRGWGERLLVTHSSHKDISVTRPRVLLELRRVGFVPVDRSKWKRFMLDMHKLTGDLDH